MTRISLSRIDKRIDLTYFFGKAKNTKYNIISYEAYEIDGN